jgi:hypothetical protein
MKHTIVFELSKGGKIFVEHLINIRQDGNHLKMVLPPDAPSLKLDSAGRFRRSAAASSRIEVALQDASSIFERP